MVNEIELLVCDKCNTVMHAAGEVYVCLDCNKPMNRVKFLRQPTKRALDGAECVCENHTDNDGWSCTVCGLLSPHRQ